MATSALVTTGNPLARLEGNRKLSPTANRLYEGTRTRFGFAADAHDAHNQTVLSIQAETDAKIEHVYAEDKALRAKLGDDLSANEQKALQARRENWLATFIAAEERTLGQLDKTHHEQLRKIALTPDFMLHKQSLWEQLAYTDEQMTELGLAPEGGLDILKSVLTLGLSTEAKLSTRKQELLARYEAALAAEGIGLPAEANGGIIDVDFTEK